MSAMTPFERTPARAASKTAALLALALVVSIAVGCSGTKGRSADVARDLGEVEVREYEGERLGPLSAFRRNQIGKIPQVDRTSYRLEVDGLVESPASYTYDEVVTEETSRTKVVTVFCVEGWSVKVLWEGVLLTDLIDGAGPDPEASTVIFHAADGYTTSLPLDYIRSRRILLAYRQNGLEMAPSRGFPFQVVAEDKYGYKWCKWVERIELSSDAEYRGYWESRGYDNDADLGAP